MILNPETINFDKCHVMAIINLTPDSFYAASRVAKMEDRQGSMRACVERIDSAIKAGATIVDLGGYSSRPGAADVDIESEWMRLRRGLDAVARIDRGVVVSLDTFRAEIVRRAYEEYGSIVVNDISAGELDEEMVATVARLGLTYVAMHMRGNPNTMSRLTDYDKGVVRGVVEYFERRTEELHSAGIARERIILDPGFGFAKSVAQNYELMAGLESLVQLGYPVLVGVSRKSMIYKPLGVQPEDALPGSLALAWESLRKGACILRVHDVAATRQVVEVFNNYKSVML